MGRICLAFLVSFFNLSIHQAQVYIPNDWIPPLKMKPVVSGSFGELRSNHFHSGLDLTTHGKTGYKVYCSDEGYVARVKVSPYGYGKAIYVNHPGGYTTVYAHLENYSERIDSVVLKQQYKERRFAVELFFKPDELPVSKGEVIAYSGNSGGSGGPHLHYEVRKTATQHPIDPLFFRQDVEDDVRPQIQGLKIYPLGTNAFVRGKHDAYYVPTVRYEGAFHPKGWKELKVLGEIGIGVQVLDYYSDSWRKCGVSSIELFANDTLVFHWMIDEFSFAETRYLNSFIDYAEKKRSGKVIQKSFIEPNNRLSLYKKGNSYTVKLQPGDLKQMKYVIKDVSGNTSVLAFCLKGEKVMNGHPPAASVDELKYDRSFHMDSLGFSVNMPVRSIYTNLPFHFYMDEPVESSLAPVYSFGDSHDPIHKSYEVNIEVPDSLMPFREKLFLAGVTATDKIYYRGGDRTGSRISGKVRSFGRFSIGMDSIAPVIRFKNLPRQANYSNQSSLQLIIKDEMSGISNYNCYIDGQWALFEYDAKQNRLEGFFDKMPFIQKHSTHQLVIKVEDNRGNQAERTLTFTY